MEHETDETTLRGWFDAYGAAMVLYARQWLDPTLAEDVVQDVFVRLLENTRRPQNVRAYLFGAVRNASINELRRRHRHARHHERFGAMAPSWFEPRDDERLDAHLAEAALLALPDDQREIVVLRIWGQLTLTELAGIVGMPISTVFARYRAALATLRKRMTGTCRGTMTS